MIMKYIGVYVEPTGGIVYAPAEAARVGARAFSVMTSAKGFRFAEMPSEAEVSAFHTACSEYGFGPDVILPHAGLMINLASPDRRKGALARKAFVEEMRYCEALGLSMLNFHPGAHLNVATVDDALRRVAESVNTALDRTRGVTAVIENSAGQGTSVGSDFEHLARIIELVDDKSRVGVCVDTCHAFSAGLDLSTPEGYDEVWRQFDATVGRQYLRAIHLNDDARALGSHIDRHAPIGEGTLGEWFFRRFMNDPRFDSMPIILETPSHTLWPQEIEWLYSLVSEPIRPD